MIPKRPYAKSVQRKQRDEFASPGQTSFKATSRHQHDVTRTPHFPPEMQEKIDQQLAILQAVGYEEWRRGLPARLKCPECRKHLQLSALDRCVNCNFQLTIIALIHMQATAKPKAYSREQMPRPQCPICGAKLGWKRKANPDLVCKYVIDGVSTDVQACNVRCLKVAKRRTEKLTRCLEQEAHIERKQIRKTEAQKQELSDLKRMLSAMKAGIKDRLKPASTSRTMESQQPETSPNS